MPVFKKKFKKHVSVLIINSENGKSLKEIKNHYQSQRVRLPIFVADNDEAKKYFVLDLLPAMWVVAQDGTLIAKDLNNPAHAEVTIAPELGLKVSEATKKKAAEKLVT